MLKLVSFHIHAHLNAFLQILEYFSQICLGPQARESPCISSFTTTLLRRDSLVTFSDLWARYSSVLSCYI